MRRSWIILAVLSLLACGDSEDRCASEDVRLALTVDDRPVDRCGNWELRVRACAFGGDCSGGCGGCSSDGVDHECEATDMCEATGLELPPGDYRLCLEAHLVNGGLAFESCTEATVQGGGDPIALSVDTEGTFPCIRDWEYRGGMCCNDMFGCDAAPED